jgi:hypothetical protein
VKELQTDSQHFVVARTRHLPVERDDIAKRH